MKENLKIFQFLGKNQFWSYLIRIFIAVLAVYGFNSSLDMMSEANDISLLIGLLLLLISLGVIYSIVKITINSLF